MLFFLTGEIQTGKTRWLSGLVEELEAAGVRVAGVLAPGVWRERGAEEIAAAARDAHAAGGGEGSNASGRARRSACGGGRFEKLGIDNLLLPQRERIAFARRADLAIEEGTHRPGSQSARAGLAWEIDDRAVARVNAHFARLAGKRADASADPEEGATGPADAGADGSLLVVDELGRLELLGGEGLVEAMRLLEAGPSRRFPHALVVVRAGLLEKAHAVFGGIWEGMADIAPDDEGREAVAGLLGCWRGRESRT